MKKERITEARIQDMLNQPTPEEWMQLEDVKTRAFAEYERRQAMEAQTAADKAARKKSRRLRTVIVCALAAALIVLPLVYTCLMPVTVSNANNFVRKATIWINDKLHLDIEIDEPLSNDGEVIDDVKIAEKKFLTFEEAAAYLGEPLLVLNCDETELRLKDICITSFPEGSRTVEQTYVHGDYECILSLKELFSLDVAALSVETYYITTEVGALNAWMNEENIRAVGVVDKWIVQLKTTLDEKTAVNAFETLSYFN